MFTLRRCGADDFRLARCAEEDYRVRPGARCAFCDELHEWVRVTVSGVTLCTCWAWADQPGCYHSGTTPDVNGVWLVPCIQCGCHWTLRYYRITDHLVYPNSPCAGEPTPGEPIDLVLSVEKSGIYWYGYLANARGGHYDQIRYRGTGGSNCRLPVVLTPYQPPPGAVCGVGACWRYVGGTMTVEGL